MKESHSVFWLLRITVAPPLRRPRQIPRPITPAPPTTHATDPLTDEVVEDEKLRVDAHGSTAAVCGNARRSVCMARAIVYI
mmetsp:Transcript_46534/g.85267  ORF Transcript_46534/g.85267 Transcript_46534/m.85267 type:complete len:81 (+) Transcript_46534:715-957(+)